MTARDRRVLVTGGTGLLGGHLVEALAARGARVHVLVRDWPSDGYLARSPAADSITRVHGDITDWGAVESAVLDHQIEEIHHLAAQAIVGVGVQSPRRTFEQNVRGTWNILEAARRSGRVRAVTVASSDKAYGASDRLPYTEEHPLGATSPYDTSKAMADLCARSYATTYGMPVVTIRCGNLYGPGDLHFDRLIPEVVRARLRGERPVIRSSGLATRDWLFVRDAARAYLLAAERAEDIDVRGHAFNISTGDRRSVIEVVAAIDRAVGVGDPEPEVLGRAEQEGEIPDQSLDWGKAKRSLGWQPESDLETGLRETVAWYRSFFNA